MFWCPILQFFSQLPWLFDSQSYDVLLGQYHDSVLNIHGPAAMSKISRQKVPQPKTVDMIITGELELLKCRFAELSSVILERKNTVMKMLAQKWQKCNHQQVGGPPQLIECNARRPNWPLSVLAYLILATNIWAIKIKKIFFGLAGLTVVMPFELFVTFLQMAPGTWLNLNSEHRFPKLKPIKIHEKGQL